MMQKRGQVVLFVILGLVLVVLIWSIFYVYQARAISRSSENRKITDVKSVSNFVNVCLQQKGVEALVGVAGKGGYFILPPYSTEQLPDNLPYFLYQGSIFVPTIEKIQENVGWAVEKRLGDCFDFISFEGIDISVEGMPEITVIFGSEQMRIILHQKVIVQNEQSETTLDSFTASVPTVFLGMYEHAKKIVETYKRSGEYVCLSCLRQLNTGVGFTIKTGMTPEGVLYALEEDKPENSKSIIFKFAVES